ncbi:hypothetical protein M0657_009896 [Pyricularia oryzae]|nr:hypothetical protein M0657_009896 [Pyricularia oryzae]
MPRSVIVRPASRAVPCIELTPVMAETDNHSSSGGSVFAIVILLNWVGDYKAAAIGFLHSEQRPSIISPIKKEAMSPPLSIPEGSDVTLCERAGWPAPGGDMR